MVELRQGRFFTLLVVLLRSCSGAVGSDDGNTIEKPCHEDNNCDIITYVLCVLSLIYIISLVGVMAYCSRNSTKTYDPRPINTPHRLEEDDSIKGRISNVELWKLVQYSADRKENDTLFEAILQLTRDKHGYGSFITDDVLLETGNLAHFQRLCRWRKTCAGTEQMDTLYEVCLQAEMGETVDKLKDFRYTVSERVSDCDLEHILWQIGKKSSENITTLLSRLTKSPFNQESSVPKNVCSALPELQKWEKGNHAINPAVMLSLQSDDWCDEDMYFFTVSEEDKHTLEPADIRQLVRTVSKAHCKQIFTIISTKGKTKRNKEEKVVNRIVDENETVLFNTYQMIKEWLDDQACSNYEKRITLRNAVEDAQKDSKSNEIHFDEIEKLASSKGNAEAAYGLLMKDIKPFANLLGLDESKLNNYKQLSSSSKSTKGTIGLVAGVRKKKGKKWF